jgi:hypothetical protein
MRLYLRGRFARLAAFLIVAGSIGGVIGCGNQTGTVSGKVYYKGEALKGGNVTFVNAENKVSRLATIQEDGSYKVEKLPAGEATITVETRSLKPVARGNLPSYSPPPGKEPPGGYKPPDFAANAKRYMPIPDRYAKPETSNLKYTVKGGSQDHEIKLD